MHENRDLINLNTNQIEALKILTVTKTSMKFVGFFKKRIGSPLSRSASLARVHSFLRKIYDKLCADRIKLTKQTHFAIFVHILKTKIHIFENAVVLYILISLLTFKIHITTKKPKLYCHTGK